MQFVLTRQQAETVDLSSVSDGNACFLVLELPSVRTVSLFGNTAFVAIVQVKPVVLGLFLQNSDCFGPDSVQGCIRLFFYAFSDALVDPVNVFKKRINVFLLIRTSKSFSIKDLA